MFIVASHAHARHRAACTNPVSLLSGYNTAECNFDDGDCCSCDCVDGDSWACGDGGYDCVDPASACLGEDGQFVMASYWTIDPNVP